LETLIKEMKPETVEDRLSRLEKDLQDLRSRHNALLRYLGIEEFENTGDLKARSTIPAPPPPPDSEPPSKPV
jgi:hypothetical protein